MRNVPSFPPNVQELGSQVLDFLHVCSYFGFNPLFMSSKNHILQLILYDKGVVSSYQIRLILPSVAETQPKMYQRWCNLQLARAVGVAVGRRSGERLATTIVATIFIIIFFFPVVNFSHRRSAQIKNFI